MHTLFRLRNAGHFALAGFAVLFMAAGGTADAQNGMGGGSSSAELIVMPGAKVTTNGWADLANGGEGMRYPDTKNIIYIGDDGYKIGDGNLTAYSSSVTKRKAFTNAIASGKVSSASVNEAAAIIVLSGMVDLSDGKVSDDDHSYFDAFNGSHKRKNGDIVYEIGSNKAIIGVNGARVAFGGLMIYANKRDRSNIIIQNIDFWDAHGSTEEDTKYNKDSKASADNLLIESNTTTKNSKRYTTYDNVPKNIWVDHCRFSDGTCDDLVRNFNHDGAFDIKAGQFVTVSYCEFTNHDKVTLLSPSDKFVNQEERQITFHHNYYHGAIQRMPRSRGCQVHLYNNIGTSGNGGYSLGPGIGSQYIVENNYFGTHQSNMVKYFDASTSTSADTFSRLYQSGNNITFTSSNMSKDKVEKASPDDVTKHLSPTAPWEVKYAYKDVLSANSGLPALIPAVAGVGKITTVKVNGVSY